MTSREMSEAFMPCGAHGDAVGDGDGVELHRRAAGLADALLDGVGDVAEMEVAGADLGPGVGDADDGLVQVFFAEADAAQVGAGGGAVGAFGEDDGVFLRIDFVASRLVFLPLAAVCDGQVRDDLDHCFVKARLISEAGIRSAIGLIRQAGLTHRS